MTIDDEIRKGEAEAQLFAQQHARKVAENEIKKLARRATELNITLESLDTEMAKTQARIKEYDAK